MKGSLVEKRSGKFKVERNWDIITIPHHEGDLRLVHPYFGPNYQKNLEGEINAHPGLRVPTPAEVISIVSSTCFNLHNPPEESYFWKLRDLAMRGNVLSFFTRIEYLPGGKARIGDVVSDDFDGYSGAEMSHDEILESNRLRSLVGDESVQELAGLVKDHGFNLKYFLTIGNHIGVHYTGITIGRKRQLSIMGDLGECPNWISVGILDD